VVVRRSIMDAAMLSSSVSKGVFSIDNDLNFD
jgi:hypothetical protein